MTRRTEGESVEDPARQPGTRQRIGRLLKYLFGFLGVTFLVATFAETWHRSQGLPIPKPWAFVVTALLILAGLGCLARSWVGLLPDQGIRRSLATAFYTSQLGRYIPGAIWQVLAQVGLATDAGASLPHASTAFGVFALIELAAGGTVGATLAFFGPGVHPILRGTAIALLVPLLFLQRGWIVWALHVVGRLTRQTFADDLVPPQRAILVSYLWTLMTLLLHSLAFALLLVSITSEVSVSRSTAAFGFAWTVGFLAVPFPSGIGIREAVLMATLAPGVPKTYVIASSVAHRLVGMICELVMIIVSRAGLKTSAPPATEVSASDHRTRAS
jgi:hypothetical protein